MFPYFISVAREDHSDASCFMCAIFSHGAYMRIFPHSEYTCHITDVIWATDTIVSLEILREPLRPATAPTLAHKPKIFIVNVSYLFYCIMSELNAGKKPNR